VQLFSYALRAFSRAVRAKGSNNVMDATAC